MENETWLEIPGFVGSYEASSFGRIRSLSRVVVRKDGKPLSIAGCILVARPNNRGYCRVTLGGKRWRSVHSLVASAFLPSPNGRIGSQMHDFTVNHKDGCKSNNSPENLEYITAKENVMHARSAGLLDVRGEGNGRSVVSDENVRQIRSRYTDGGVTQAKLAAMFGIDQTNISRIIRGVGWRHVS